MPPHVPLLQSHGLAARAAINGYPGLTWLDIHRGQLRAGRRSLGVRLERGDTLALALWTRSAPDAAKALATQTAVGTNARHALRGERPVVLAEATLAGLASADGAAVRAALDEAAAAVLDLERHAAPAPEIDSPAVDLAPVLAALGYPASDVVALDAGAELRLRVGGRLTPVRIHAEPGGARAERVVLASVPAGPAASAVLHETLRANGRLRLARLSLREGRIVAEARLSTTQLNGPTLRTAVEAVAVAAHYAHARLAMLAEHTMLAECYAALWTEAPVLKTARPEAVAR